MTRSSLHGYNLLLGGEQTDRLLFRELLASDFDQWLPFYEDDRSTQYWSGLSKDPNKACKEQFQKTFERYELGLGGMNALLHKSTKELIGICGLLIQEVDGQKELEIGYSVLPKFWQRGFASEAAKKCKEFAFAHRLATSLISIVHVDNLASQKVALKIGMDLDKMTIYKENPVQIFRVSPSNKSIKGSFEIC